MNLNIITLKSSLHDEKALGESTLGFLKEVTNELNKIEKTNVTINENNNDGFNLIFIETGGSEGLFLKNKDNLKEPYYLLTNGNNNSLAASLEIMTYININNLKGEVIHGNISYVSNRIYELYKINELKKKLNNINLGVIGKPSDWLISSIPSYDLVKKKLGINLIDIPISKLEDFFNKTSFVKPSNIKLDYNNEELLKANKIYNGLDILVKEYKLDGLTLRCFDLLTSVKTTGCIGLALLNNEKIIATCEGDIAAMLSMTIATKLFDEFTFQANPSRIDTEKNNIIFAHCTIPFGMLNKFNLTTHFESKTGVAVKGYLKEEDVTILRISSNLKNYFLSEGHIIRNLDDPNLCRTQIEVHLDCDVKEILKNPCGNHHIIFYGRHKKLLKLLLDELLK